MSSTDVDGDAGLADVAHHARMVAVIAAVRRQIEGDRHPLLPGRQRLAVEGVDLLGGREAGVLPDRPGPPGIHRRPRPAGIGREAGQAAEMVQPSEIGLGVERLDRDPLRRLPGQALAARALQLAPRQRLASRSSPRSSPPPSTVRRHISARIPRRSAYVWTREGEHACVSPLSSWRSPSRCLPPRRQHPPCSRPQRPRTAEEPDARRPALGRPPARRLRRHARRPALRPADADARGASREPLAERDVVILTDTDPAAQRPAAPAAAAPRTSAWC